MRHCLRTYSSQSHSPAWQARGGPTPARGRRGRARIRLATVFTALLLACTTAAQAQPVQIALVPVGDPGNVADPLTGYGSVSYSYSIGEYDVTMGQYAAFLNAVATTGDLYGCWNPSMSTATPTYGITRTSTKAGYTYTAKGNSANVPVTYVSWGDTCRFVNWLANGEPTGPEGPGTTETGTYYLNGGTTQTALMAVTRSTTAGWVLPNLNEWYKSAYYAGGGTDAAYWTYATQSDDVPSNVLSVTGTNNANYEAILGQPPTATRTDPTDWLTPVGAFADSPSAFGTYDETGDVYQWDETAIGTSRGLRGGGFADFASDLISGTGADTGATLQNEEVGFRVAYVPEPNTGAILTLGAIAGYAALRYRKYNLR